MQGKNRDFRHKTLNFELKLKLMTSEKPLILLSNDDGIHAPGLHLLVNLAREFGRVCVVAPDSPQSGQGHAITLEQPLRLEPSGLFGPDVLAYACNGTPADCVKLAKNVVLRGQKIAFCLSGINHGSNASVSIIYSGTVSAAREAAMEGIASLAFSHVSHSHAKDLGVYASWLRQILREVFIEGLQGAGLLNINLPDLAPQDIKGFKYCHQAKGHWHEDFRQGQDPQGRTYYWLTGRFICEDDSPDSDIAALAQGYISIVPAMHDLTDYTALARLRSPSPASESL